MYIFFDLIYNYTNTCKSVCLCSWILSRSKKKKKSRKTLVELICV